MNSKDYKIKDLIIYGKQYIVSPQVEAVLCQLLNINTFELLNSFDEVISDQKIINKFKSDIKKIYNKQPIDKVIKNINFCDIPFYINDDVILPHFETQELVKQTMGYIEKLFNGKGKLIDLGCGSGVIGLSIKKAFPQVAVDLLDISDKALAISKINATNLNLSVNFIKNDMLNDIDTKYDIIVSNPPYETESYKPTLDNEPNLALYAGKEGLDNYIKILKDIKHNLNDKFLIVFEIGDYQKEKVINLINDYLDNVIIRTLESKKGFEKSIYIFNGFNESEI